MKINFSDEAFEQLTELRNQPDKIRILKDVSKAIRYMAVNLRHPSLYTHQYHSLSGPNGEKMFEAYAQNKTPGAYRIFWYYGPDKNSITIISIVAHP